MDALGSFTYEDDSPSDPAHTVEPHTMFDVASLTKVASTTAIAMLLFQRGLLDLETPLGDLLPRFVVGRDDSILARQITLRHLLAHNSGLPGYVELFRTATTPSDLSEPALNCPSRLSPANAANIPTPDSSFWERRLRCSLGKTCQTWRIGRSSNLSA